MTGLRAQTTGVLPPPLERGTAAEVVPVALRHIVSTAWRVSPRRTAAIALASVLRGLLPLGIVVSLARGVDAVTGLAQGAVAMASTAVIALSAQFVLQAAALWLSDATAALQRRVAALVRFELERQFVHALVRLDVTLLETPETHARLARLRSGGSNGAALVGTMAATLTAVVTLIAMVVLVTLIHPIATTLLLVVVLMLLALHLRGGRDRFEHGVRTQGAELQAEYWLNLLTNPLAALDIRAFGLADWLERRWGELAIAAQTERWSGSRTHDKTIAAAQVIAALATLALSLTLIALVGQGLLSVGVFVASGAIVAQTVGATQQFAQSMGTAVESSFAHADLLVITSPLHHAASALPLTLTRELRLDHVTFRYPGSPRDALTNISCVVPRGQRVLVVGPNGAGKSTLGKLLAGLYRPRAGRVLWDDVDACAAPVGSTAISSILLQGYVYYDVTVRDNLKLGDVARWDDDSAAERWALAVGIDGAIRSWPHGYESMLGSWLVADGVIPSQGERVKLAVARALNRDAECYILDEPTAGLDPVAAAQVSAAICDRTVGRTLLVVSHDLGLWSFVDRVVVLDGGRIVADGPRAEIARRSEWLSGLLPPAMAATEPTERPHWA